MTFIRHSSRHVHQTVADYVKDRLHALDWDVPGSVPFDAPAIKVQTTAAMPNDRSDVAKKIAPGMVAITVGDEDDTIEEELGGPLVTMELPLFIDIFMDSDATALALANDIRDILKGRLPDTVRTLPLINQVDSTPVDGWRIEFTDVLRARPDSNGLHWQVVKVTATTTFSEVVYG